MSVDNTTPSADAPTTTDADTSTAASDTGPVPANVSAANHHTVDPTPSDSDAATSPTGNIAHDAYMAALCDAVSGDN